MKKHWPFLLIAAALASVPASAGFYPHIKTYAYYLRSSTADQEAFTRAHFDLYTGTRGGDHCEQYVTWSDFSPIFPWYLPLYNTCLARGVDFDDMFVHYAKDVMIPRSHNNPAGSGTTVIAPKEDKFFRVLLFDGPAWQSGANARSGGSLSFNGVDNSVDMGTAINASVGRTISYEAWIRPRQKISTQIAGWGPNNGLWIDAYGQVVAEMNVDGTRRGAPRYRIPAYDQWYHVAGVCDAETGSTRLYVNGQEVGRGTAYAPGAVTALSGPFRIGAGNGFFSGIIDDVRLYSVALSSTQVQQRYQSNAFIGDGLLGWWQLDEGTGDAIGDASGHGFTGKIGYLDRSAEAFGDRGSTAQNYDLQLSTNVDDCVYIGHPWKYREINVNLSVRASADWNGAWEYWNGSAWTALAVTDGTSDMQMSGKVSFAPPPDWARKEAGGITLFWTRLRCTAKGATPPVAHSEVQINGQYEWQGTSAISGWKYAVSGSSYVVPGWDPANDRNGDGFVDDGEFAVLADTSATARFKYNAIAPAWYFTNRWVMNPGNALYREFIAVDSQRQQQASGAGNLFVDNANFRLADNSSGKERYLEYSDPATQFPADVRLALRGIKQQVRGTVVINFGGSETYNYLVDEVDGAMFEVNLEFGRSYKTTPANLANFYNVAKTYAANNKMLIINGYGSIGQGGTVDIPHERDEYYELARYYLTATGATYFSFWDAVPWEDWMPAIAYDIGQPQGDLYVYRTIMRDYPSTPPANLVQNASFEVSADGRMPDVWQCWQRSGTRTECSVSSACWHGGRSSLVIRQTAGNQSVEVQYVSLLPNTTYTLSGWIKTENVAATGNSTAQIFAYAGTGAAAMTGTSAITQGAATSDWTFLVTTFRTGSDTAQARVYCICDGVGTAWFDDIRLEQGEFPPEYVFARKFTKALVLLKPVPDRMKAATARDIDETTAVPVPLEQPCYPLRYDGTLGQVTNVTSLRNYEGAILIPQEALPPGTTNDTMKTPLKRTFLTSRTPVVFSDTEEVEIRDARGRSVATLRAGGGTHSIIWRGGDEAGNRVESGVYIFKARTTDGKQTYGAIVVAR